jgi:hypothetical protein
MTKEVDMFEKEAEEMAEEYYYKTYPVTLNIGEEERKKAVTDIFLAGYSKANEWHYMKDVNCYEDLHFPPEEECKGKLLIWKVQVITEKGVKLPVCYHCGSYGDLWYEINAYHVIAWKEIVLPKEIK